MRGLVHRAAAVAAACAALLAAPAAQALDIGGLSLDEAGFADTLVSSTGVFTTSSGTLADALTDGSLSTWAMSTTAGAKVVLGFTDRVLVNGAGNDLALFERGHEAYEYSQEGFDSFNVTINGITRLYFTTETTTIIDDYNVNMTTVDLSFFGVAEGATVSQVQIGLDYNTRGSLPQLQLVAGINTVAAVPEPATVLMTLAGLGVVGVFARRRQRAAAA
ncbi:PEP-CTERM sorting domain-containing protein [Aquincola tertiaricarbonis]|uniref:PEP-CTERM sorting domain-containing protein n=1 Tax=Aquincola tertiaricarbonis TaxID=391953 RepID=UPI0006150752|nr:PEP-CTERM sorting domain-containing protein [Aquincola tertiaricarbonis]